MRAETKEPGHFLRPLKMPFGMGMEGKARLIQRASQPDAGKHILKLPKFRDVIVHIVGRHQRYAQIA